MRPARLVFIERPEHVERALALSSDGAATQIIALSPNAGYELSKRGAAFKDGYDFYDLEQMAALDTANIERTENFCRWTDAYLRERVAELGALGLECALMCYINFRHLINNAAMYCLVLGKIREAYPDAGEFVFFRAPREAVSYDLIFHDESFWPRLLARQAKTWGVASRALECELPRRPAGRASRERTFEKMAALAQALLRAAFGGAGKWLFILIDEYSVRPVLEENRRGGYFRVLNLLHVWKTYERLRRALRRGPVGKDSRALLSAVWEEIRQEPELRRTFQFSGVDAFELVEDRLSHFFNVLTADMIGIARFCETFFSWARPDVIVASTMGRYHEKAIASCAKRRGIPFVVYQHGEMGLRTMGPRSHNFWYYNDLYFSDRLLVFGEGQVRFCREKYGSSDAVVPVGSAALDALGAEAAGADRGELRRRLGLSAGRRVVVYPPGQMGHGIKVPPTYRTDSANFKVQTRLVDLFARFPEIDFIVKPHTAQHGLENPLRSYLKDKAFANIRLETAVSFKNLVCVGDLFVFDWASTALLEALTTDKPIFVTDHLLNWDWQPWAREQFGARVQYERDLDAFVARLEEYLRRDSFEAFPDRTFLRRYGTYLDDGGSARRAVAALAGLNGGAAA